MQANLHYHVILILLLSSVNVFSQNILQHLHYVIL